MAYYNPTNYFTTLGDYSNVYVDLGTVFVDLSYNETIYATKTYTTSPMTNYPSAPYQLTNKQYIDDNFNTFNCKLTVPINNSNYTNPTIQQPSGWYQGMTNQSVNRKVSVTPLQNFTAISRKQLSVQIDSPANVDTIYTFGVSRPSFWLAGGASQFGGNSLAYSYDGINWTGISSPDVSGVRALVYNGSIFVAGTTVTALTADGTNYGPYGGRTTLAYSFNGMTWTPNWYAMNIISGSVNSLAWNGYIFVAGGYSSSGGSGNTLAYSWDGIRWFGSTNTILTGHVNSVAWNGQMWMAAGNGPGYSTAYSYNGKFWFAGTATANTPSAIGNCIATNGQYWLYGGGTIVGVTNTLYSSWNGAAWFNGGAYAGLSNVVNGLAWNGFMWVAVGGGSRSIAYSYNGYTWVNVSNDTSIFNTTSNNVPGRCVAWNGYMWVAGGQTLSAAYSTLAYSYNGMQWLPLGNNVLSMTCNAVIWCGRRENLLVFPQNRTIVSGYDNTWARMYMPPLLISQNYNELAGGAWQQALSFNSNDQTQIFGPGAPINGIAWNGYKWVAVATASTGTYGTIGTMAFSTIGFGNQVDNVSSLYQVPSTSFGNAGNIWVPINNRVFNWAGTSIVFNGNIWAATGSGGNTLAWSPDGNFWIGLGGNVFSTIGQTIAWNGNYFIAGGQGANTLAYSVDGIQWTGLGSNVFNYVCNGVAWNGSYWVGVGWGGPGYSGNTFGYGNTIGYSVDGINWVGLGNRFFSNYGNCIAYGGGTNGLWVAGGNGGNALLTSYDGINWNAAAAQNSHTVVYSTIWNGKYWLCTGNNGLSYSIDGSTWQNASAFGTLGTLSAGFGTVGSCAVGWNQGMGTLVIRNNYLVRSTWNSTAVLSVFYGARSTLYYTTDGTNWTAKVQQSYFDQVQGIAFNGKIWVGTINCAAGGALYSFIYSYDGINWFFANTPFTDNVGPPVTNNTMFVAGSYTSNIIYYSFDGINWAIGGNSSGFFPIYAFAWNHIAHIWIGMGGATAYTTGTGVAYSIDGVWWKAMPNLTIIGAGANSFNSIFICRSVVFNGAAYVAVGNPTSAWTAINNYSSVWYSPNGWQWHSGLFSNPVTNTYLGGVNISGDVFSNWGNAFAAKVNGGRSVTWNGRLWVACGSGLQYGSNTSIVYSYDGFVWSNLPNNTDPFGLTGYALNVFWNGSMFLCSGISSNGYSQIAYSFNGLNWNISPYNNFGTSVLSSTFTSAFMSNSLRNVDKVLLNFYGATQSKTLDVVAENYYNPGYNKITFFA